MKIIEHKTRKYGNSFFKMQLKSVVKIDSDHYPIRCSHI